MRKFKILFKLFIFITFFNHLSYSMDFKCYEFLEGLKDLKYDLKKTNVEETIMKDLGFDLLDDPIPGIEFSDEEENFLKKRRTKKNYPIIGAIVSSENLDKIKNKDILISIDGRDLSKLNDDEIDDLIYPNEIGKNHDLLIERGGQKIKVQVKSHEYRKEYRPLQFALNSINEINIKNSTIKFSGFIGSDREYKETVGWEIVKHARNTISYFDDEEQENKKIDCPEIPYDYAKENRLPISGESLGFFDLISEDKDKVFENVGVYVYDDTNTDEKDDIILSIEYYAEGEWEIKNKFNLVSFPFDRQKIIIKLVDGDLFEDVYLAPYQWNYVLLNYTKENLKIPGWNLIDVKFNTGNNFDIGGLVFNQATIELDIERQSFYYIFKIIFPITLILLICWSSVWLNPKEVESKLTISIVCLLSLIAYNFVIDNELPKLEYLTIMDWIILASYLFAAAPNMLAIVTFQMSNKIKYKKLNLKIDQISKRYGITSYILLIFIIVIINVSIVPDNTINALSWAMMR